MDFCALLDDLRIQSMGLTREQYAKQLEMEKAGLEAAIREAVAKNTFEFIWHHPLSLAATRALKEADCNVEPYMLTPIAGNNMTFKSQG